MSVRGTIDPQSPMSSAPPDEWRSDLPNLVKSDPGSSYRFGILLTGESVPQAHAAALTRARTSFIDGRSAGSVRQQSSSNLQILSERPRSGASVGFEGRSPPKTFNTTSGPDSFPNGDVPVSTYTGRIGKQAR